MLIIYSTGASFNACLRNISFVDGICDAVEAAADAG